MAKHPVNIEQAQQSLRVLNFQVDGVLGEGAFGVVHSVRDQSGNVFAVKTVKTRGNHKTLKTRRTQKEINADEKSIFQTLINAQQQQQQEEEERVTAGEGEGTPGCSMGGGGGGGGVVQMYAVLEAGPFTHLIMERLEGSNLEEYIAKYRQGGMAQGEVRLVIRDVLRGLAFLHHLGILHRDVKPANVFVEHDAHGTVRGAKVIDVGSGRLFPASSRGAVECGVALTRSVDGSPIYMCPSVEQGNGYGADCDLWGAGNVLYYAATGKNLVASNMATYRRDKLIIWENCSCPGYRFPGVVSDDVNFILQSLLTKNNRSDGLKNVASTILEDYWFASSSSSTL